MSAWLAVNAIREWRGDTHWAIQFAEDVGQVESLCRQFLDLIEAVGDRLVARIDVTAGPDWMPAARDRGSR